MDLARDIHEKALELGFDGCGIIRVSDYETYYGYVERRLRLFPELAEHRQLMYFYDRLQLKTKPGFVRSVIVCPVWYGHYRLPDHIQGQIGKVYAVDHRHEAETQACRATASLSGYLDSLGIRYDREWGGARWAAYASGLGILRRNNFLYTGHGSWQWLETWAIDRELEYRSPTPNLAPCPPNCRRCMDACPTGALSAPYTMNPAKCVTYLTYLNDRKLPDQALRGQMQGWLYGCDACQDACPMNRGAWLGRDEFPHLEQLAEHLTPKEILDMDDERLRALVTDKYWYILERRLWQWRANALRAMAVCYDPSCRPYLLRALDSEQPQLAEMARWAWAYVQEHTP